MTEYVVLRYQRLFGEVKIEGGAWVELGRPFARSASSAIRQVIEDQDGDYGQAQYAATPARSFKPVTVQVETKTALRFS